MCMEMAMEARDGLFPGSVVSMGTVAYATADWVWVYTLAGVRGYAATKGTVEPSRPRLRVVSRRAA